MAAAALSLGDDRAQGAGVIRVLITGTPDICLVGTRVLFEWRPGFRVVGEAGTGRLAIAQAGSLRPDLLILDDDLDDPGGLEIARATRRASPATRILAWSLTPASERRRHLLDAGVGAYLPKSVSYAALLAALPGFCRGEGISDLPPPTEPAIPSRAEETVVALTPREREVLRLVAAGGRNREIAAALCVSVSTVEFHVRRLFAKLEVGSRVQLLIAARRNRLIPK